MIFLALFLFILAGAFVFIELVILLPAVIGALLDEEYEELGVGFMILIATIALAAGVAWLGVRALP